MAEVARQLESLDGGVAVGIDGSDCARMALRYALDEARRRGATLHVVRAWGIANAPRPAGAEDGYVPSFAEFAQACEEQVAAELRRAGSAGPAGPAGPAGQAPAGTEGADVRVHVVHGSPARAMLAASERAEVVVVGSRGRGGFAGLALGSTTEQLVRHASCPVVVVRGRDWSG